MRSLSIQLFSVLAVAQLAASLLLAQADSASPDAAGKTSASASGIISEPLITLQATSSMNLSSEIGGAFMPPVKCDADGNLYIRRFASNRTLGPVVKIDSDGKPTALFAPSAFATLGLDRVDAFSPAPDGGIYQIAQKGIIKPIIYVLHYSPDGSVSSTRLDADFEVYSFAAFPNGSFLVSGTRRDPMDKNDHGRGVTEVFSADGTELAAVSFQEPAQKSRQHAHIGSKGEADAGAKTEAVAANRQTRKEAPSATAKIEPVKIEPEKISEKQVAALDVADAEAGRDGNLYAMRASAHALVDVISPSGKIMKTLKIATPLPPAAPNSFHASENRLAVLFWNDEKQTLAIAVVDAQTGRKIAAYSSSTDFGTFACYSANDGVFTFLKYGDGNVMEVIHAEAQ